MRLPGMAQEKADATTTEWRSYDQERPMAKKEETDTTASRDLRSNFESMSKEGTVRPAQTAPLVSKPLFDANDSKPSDVHGAAEAESTLGHTSSIMGGGRSPSPTKGLGGFVQSAMMRRSDSVSKRWSVQANSGLKRGDSVAGNRPVFSPLTAAPAPLGHARTLSREPRALRDGTSSPLSGSRPSSSHDQVQQDHLLSQALRPSSQVSNTPDMVQNKTSPTIPEHRPSTPPSSEPTLGRSPSKTMDPRRWSPTKASWLESALSKPESPRPAPLKPEPPTWKLDMQRSKSQKDLQESLTRPTSSFDPVSTGSLLRSPPPGTESKPPPLFGDTISKQTRPVAAPARLDDRKDTEAKQQSFSKVSTTPSSEQSRTLKEPALENASTRTEAADRKPEHMTEPTSKPDFRTSQNRQIPALKPKPQTPPKTDFRASLKCRQTGNADSADNEPEFKAVFGKLKKAQTQNYVAPDMLKANISRGKAALTVTGGPQQTKRVDEFKESILAKKDAMKQGGGSIHKKTNTDVQEKPVADVPEALARRKTLSKAKPSMDADSIEPLHTQRSIVDKTAPETKSIPASRFESKPAPERGSRPEPIKATIKPEVAEKGKEAAVVAPVRGLTGVSDQPKTFKAPTEQQERCPSPVKNGPDTLSGKLAARMNPALASLIARGGSPRPQPESVPSDTVTEMGVVKTQSAETPSGDLQHMTKGRAKGPKRRAPKAETKIALDETTQSAISTPPVTKAVSAPVQEQSPVKSAWKTSAETGSVPLPKSSPVKARFTAPTPVRESKPPGAVDSPTPRTPSDNSPGPRARPAVASKSPELRRVSNKESAVEAKEDRPLSRPTTNNKTFDIATDVTSHEPPSKTKTPVREMIGKQEARSLPLTPSKSRMNSPPKSLDMPYANLSPGKIKPKAAGLGLTMNESAKKTMTADVLTPPPESDMAFRARNTLSPAKAKETTQVSKIIQTHFGTLPRSADRGDFDTEAYLKAQSSETAREKTLNKQIWEVTGDGKRTALPPGQDHILYEECMYLCVHTFENEKGSRTSEANLWTGDAVSDAAIEDAQLFCRKIARENSAKLEVVRQGKETSKFFSALGGIVIIRKTKSSALYMLCGRRHHGHVAFDEVEMSAARLCSGFPFLLSAKFGKLYLWKGQGSGVDEISAAKLISMDLSLTDEVEEISEGSEPPSFWENFADAKAFQPSEMWSVRSMDQQKGFPCRLYRLEPERPKSSGGFWGLRAASPPKASNKVTLQEISSFTQKDLDPGSVHILDAYANIYV